MFRKAKNRKRTVAAVDVGSHAVKILEAAADQGEYTITKFAVKELPPDKSPESLQEAIKNALDEVSLDAKDIRISLSGPHAIVRFITTPEMTKEELAASLHYEADKY
ncbi:MAG: pilus assembly protein PilM, partial [Candidatus Omnitrophica bacterium]|nr:pilus assembly protein PilM [Candidatus Omnitrophota bacterium]